VKEWLTGIGVAAFAVIVIWSLCKRTPSDLDRIDEMDWREVMRRKYRGDDGWWL
jgi:hypothetical protein